MRVNLRGVHIRGEGNLRVSHYGTTGRIALVFKEEDLTMNIDAIAPQLSNHLDTKDKVFIKNFGDYQGVAKDLVHLGIVEELGRHIWFADKPSELVLVRIVSPLLLADFEGEEIKPTWLS